MPSYTTSNANDTNRNHIRWTPPAIVERPGQKHSLAAETDCPNNSQQNFNKKKFKWSPSTSVQEYTKPTEFRPTIDLTDSDVPSSPNPHKQLTRRDKLLESIKNFVESLPSYLHQPAQDMALTLLTCADEFSQHRILQTPSLIKRTTYHYPPDSNTHLPAVNSSQTMKSLQNSTKTVLMPYVLCNKSYAAIPFLFKNGKHMLQNSSFNSNTSITGSLWRTCS